MQQQATGSFNTPQVSNSSTGLQPPATICYPPQFLERAHPSTTTPGITRNTACDNTPSTSCVITPGTLTGMPSGTRLEMAPSVVPGMAPGVAPCSTLDNFHGIALPGSTPARTPGTTLYTPSTSLDRVSDTTSDMTPGSINCTTAAVAPRIFPDTTPGSCTTAKMDLVAAARSNHVPSAIKMPRQVATPRQQPLYQSQKRKASVTAANPSTQQYTTRPKSNTASEPLHQHLLHHKDHTRDPQQQVRPSLAMPVTEVHQAAPDDTAAQSSSKKSRKKLLQQCVLPFQTVSGEPVTAPVKHPVPAKSSTKKPHKQPVSLVCCVTKHSSNMSPC